MKSIGCGLVLAILFSTGLPAHGSLPVLRSPVRIILKKSGIPVYLVQDSISNNTYCYLFFSGGKSSDPPGKQGLSHLTGHFLLRSRSNKIRNTLLRNNIEYTLNVHDNYTVIGIRILSPSFKKSLILLTSFIRKPGINKKAFNSFKQKWLDHIPEGPLDPEIRFIRSLYRRLYPLFPFSGPVSDSSGFSRDISLIDLKNHYNKYFVRSNLFLTCTSNLHSTELLEILDKGCLNVRKKPGRTFSSRLRSPVWTPFNRTDIHKKYLGTEPVIGYGGRLPLISRRNYALAWMLKVFLGRSPGSFLWNLRQPEGLAYYMISDFHYSKNSGAIYFYLRTTNDTIGQAEQNLETMLQIILKKGISRSKLEQIKELAVVDILNTLQSRRIKVYISGHFISLGLGHRFAQDLPRVISSISLEEFNVFLGRMLAPHHLVKIYIGK